VCVRTSPRLTRSWGRAQPALGRVSIHPALIRPRFGLLQQVLCHEAAHVAAYLLYGPDVRPHGPEWRELVVRAGHDPALRLPGPDVAARQKSATSTPRYRHRCPVCQMIRVAKRRVPAWRCASCVAGGFEGRLIISRLG